MCTVIIERDVRDWPINPVASPLHEFDLKNEGRDARVSSIFSIETLSAGRQRGWHQIRSPRPPEEPNSPWVRVGEVSVQSSKRSAPFRTKASLWDDWLMRYRTRSRAYLVRRRLKSSFWIRAQFRRQCFTDAATLVGIALLKRETPYSGGSRSRPCRLWQRVTIRSSRIFSLCRRHGALRLRFPHRPWSGT